MPSHRLVTLPGIARLAERAAGLYFPSGYSLRMALTSTFSCSLAHSRRSAYYGVSLQVSQTMTQRYDSVFDPVIHFLIQCAYLDYELYFKIRLGHFFFAYFN